MRIDIVRHEEWDVLNETLKEQLKAPEKTQVRAFRGMAHAVYELAHGTSQFMTHKKSVAFITGQTPEVDQIIPFYYKETYNVQASRHTEMSSSSEVLEKYVSSLKTDTAFVIFAEDHPVTAERYPWAAELEKLLNSKRIIALKISHFQHLQESPAPLNYSVHISSYDSEHTVAFLGERYRCPVLFTAGMFWDAVGYSGHILKIKTNEIVAPEAAQDILSFESQVAQWGGKEFFASTVSRVFDRAVIVFEDLNAQYLKERLMQKLQISEQDQRLFLETPTSCSGQVVSSFGDWWLPTPSHDQVRGMLLLHWSLLRHSGLAQALSESVKEIRAEQSWTL